VVDSSTNSSVLGTQLDHPRATELGYYSDVFFASLFARSDEGEEWW
jgi:hypothetical protein